MEAGIRFPVLESGGDISMICTEKMNELYGDFSPDEMSKRLADELRSITQNDFESLYMISKLLVDKASRNGRPTGTRWAGGSSFVAFLLGITGVNPLRPHYRCKSCKCVEFVPGIASGFDLPDKPCPKCGMTMTGDGHNLPFEVFGELDGDRTPDFPLNATSDMAAKGKELLEEILPNYVFVYAGYRDEKTNQLQQELGGLLIIPREFAEDVPVEYIGVNQDVAVTAQDYHNHNNELWCYWKQDIFNDSCLDALYKLSSETGVPLESIPMNDWQVFEAVFANADTFGTSEFDNDFDRHMMKIVKPKTFSDLMRISGISHGTYPWSEWDNDTEENFIPSELPPLSEIIAFRDDVMVYLIEKGIDRETAFKIMTCTRKGGFVSGSDYWKDKALKYNKAMTDAGVPDWYIESCNRIRYLSPKAHSVSYVMNSIRLAWFKVHYPAEFQKAFEL